MINILDILASKKNKKQWNIYLDSIVKPSINADSFDTMQCFLGGVVVHNGVIYLYYTGNEETQDDDRIFLVTKPDDGQLLYGWERYLENGTSKIIIDRDATEDEIFVRHVYYDDNASEFRMYYTVRPSDFPNTKHYTALATSIDGVNYTKQGLVYSDIDYYIVSHYQYKNSITDYVAIVTGQLPAQQVFTHFYLTSSDGINWTKQSDITFTDGAIVGGLIKIEGWYYINMGNGGSDPSPPTRENIIIKRTQDFTNFENVGTLLSTNQPSERGIGWGEWLIYNGGIYLFYNFMHNWSKNSANGGEAFMGIRLVYLNSLMFNIDVYKKYIYHKYVTNYYPLYHKDEGNIFQDVINKSSTIFTSPNWTTLKFLQFNGDGITFSPIIYNGYDLSFRARVEIITTGIINVLTLGTDIQVTIENGKLRVRLNNSAKDYISISDIAKPSGISNDPDNYCNIGFIFKNGTLRLCNSYDVNLNHTKTVDEVINAIFNNNNNVEICSNSTIEARSFIFMTGQTDEQYITCDL